MNKSNKIIIIISLIVIFFSISGYFGIKYYLKKDLEKAKSNLEETIEKYGYIEKENVLTLISKFNTEIMDNGLEFPASDDYLTIENNEYWYGLYDDIHCFIIPEKFTGNKEEDIVAMIGIYYPKNSPNKELAQKYVINLLKANNNKLTDKDIKDLINNSNNLSSKNKNAQSGKGIALALKETDDYYNYQVIRIYK